MVDAKNDLDKLPFSVKGATGILNIGSFNTLVAEVTDHKQGQKAFNYQDKFGKIHYKPQNNIYFLEDKLELLDQAQEWFLNKSYQTLYFWVSDGTDATGHRLIEKVQDYPFNITNSSHIVFTSLDFFGTTLWAFSLSSTNLIANITLDLL